MPLIKYITKRFNRHRTMLIEKANQIIAEYAADDMKLTLRQLYYQFVARDILANKLGSYKQLGGAVSEGRLAGLIDWDAIEDRARNVQDYSTWESPEQILRGAAASFRLDRWLNQPVRVICLIEKEALAGIFDQACGEYDVPLLPCKGYLSQSEMWAMAQRIREHVKVEGQRVVLLHFGDHDPSGMDMSRDIRDRLELLTFGFPITVKATTRNDIAMLRLALNFNQIERYKPPPNPAKETDARFKAYEEEYGDQSWELDALEPRVLRTLVKTRVKSLIDHDKWDAVLEREEELRKDLDNIARHFPQAANAAKLATLRKKVRKALPPKEDED